jgi:hypothetical protein
MNVMLRKMRVLNFRVVPGTKAVLLAGLLASGMAVSQLEVQASSGASASTVNGSSPVRYKPNRVPKREGEYFAMVWGVDSLRVKSAESGDLIRFSYRVLDPEKSKVLNDKKIEAFLDSPTAHARLVVPTLEKVGQLRQGNTPEAGTSYWMAFSNPRRTVKRGDHVNIVIGQFHADGLVVE